MIAGVVIDPVYGFLIHCIIIHLSILLQAPENLGSEAQLDEMTMAAATLERNRE